MGPHTRREPDFPHHAIDGLKYITFKKMLNILVSRFIQEPLMANIVERPENPHIAIGLLTSKHFLIAHKPLFDFDTQLMLSVVISVNKMAVD